MLRGPSLADSLNGDILAVPCKYRPSNPRKLVGRDSPRRDRWPKIGSGREKVSAETEPPTSKPANCGPLASLREIFRFERLRGGPGRSSTGT
jgi:hypothetical protein